MLRIGAIALDIPVVQAALSGYSDLAMRRVARLHGVPYALNEVVLDRLVLTRGRQRRRIMEVPADDHPVGGQLMGSEPADFARAAGALVEAGYDCVDINLACPVRKVLGRYRGGFLLSQPQRALDILRGVLEAVEGRRPVTVKMRRGLDETADSERDFFAIFDGAMALGVSAVTVHARTVKQRYAGRSDWSFLARVKRHAGDRVVLGSGDLFSAEDCLRMMRETGVDGVTVARGCIGNPWLFEDVRALLSGGPLPPPPSVTRQGETIRRHQAWAVALYGERVACKVMRKFGIKYSELHPAGAAVRDAFIQAKNSQDWHKVLVDWYDPGRAWPAVRRREGPGHLIAAGAAP